MKYLAHKICWARTWTEEKILNRYFWGTNIWHWIILHIRWSFGNQKKTYLSDHQQPISAATFECYPSTCSNNCWTLPDIVQTLDADVWISHSNFGSRSLVGHCQQIGTIIRSPNILPIELFPSHTQNYVQCEWLAIHRSGNVLI